MISANPAQTEFEARMERARKKREARKTPKLKRSRPKRIPVEHRAAAEEWRNMPWLQRCEVCWERPAVDPHHCVRDQVLERLAGPRRFGWDYQAVRWDVRNRLWVCRECHATHTDHAPLIPIWKLPMRVFEFARELQIEWVLEREYAHEQEAA